MCFFCISWSVPLYFPLDKLGRVHWDFKCQLSLSETEGMSQPGSLSNLDAAIDTEIIHLSSAVNPEDRASWCSKQPQKRLDSSPTVCQLWKLRPSPAGADVATKSSEIGAWPRLDHAEIETNPQAFKNQSSGPGTRPWTGKLKRRSPELGSWLRASL